MFRASSARSVATVTWSKKTPTAVGESAARRCPQAGVVPETDPPRSDRPTGLSRRVRNECVDEPQPRLGQAGRGVHRSNPDELGQEPDAPRRHSTHGMGRSHDAVRHSQQVHVVQQSGSSHSTSSSPSPSGPAPVGAVVGADRYDLVSNVVAGPTRPHPADSTSLAQGWIGCNQLSARKDQLLGVTRLRAVVGCCRRAELILSHNIKDDW